MSRLHFCLSSLFVLAFSLDAKGDEDSFPPLKGKEPPQNFEELWEGYDPSREPLEVQVVHEWKNEGITTRMLTYSVGTFKGTCSQMGAYYSFPDGAFRKSSGDSANARRRSKSQPGDGGSGGGKWLCLHFHQLGRESDGRSKSP